MKGRGGRAAGRSEEGSVFSTRFLVRAAMYAALYAALTLMPGLNALAYGAVQFRVAESLLPLACVDPAAVVGLTVGTALGNLGSPMFFVDVVFGALLTLVAVSLMYRIGPHWYALAVPVVVNGFGVAAMLAAVMHLPFWASVVWVSAGEAAVMATGGAVVMVLVRRRSDLFGITRPSAG